MSRVRKRYDQMSAGELARATREFDRELPLGPDGLPGRPMNAAERKQWAGARAKMSANQNGLKRVVISLDARLLQQSDAFARKHDLSRSEMISAGLRMLMAG